ncbi:MAG: anti-sigma factor family protein [Candidatus Aminicenantes bacterium]
MSCEKIEELLSPYLEDDLSIEEKRAVEAHLEKCQACTDLLMTMKEARESLAGFPELEVSENLWKRLYAIPGRKKPFFLDLDFLLRPSLQPVLAGVTILLIMISFYLFHPDRSYIEKTIDRQAHLGYSKFERLYAQAESFTDNLGAYKDNILVSLKNVSPFGESEE